jgi:hypothetical protein
MIGPMYREGGLWVQSFGLSVVAHAAIGGLLLAPAIDLFSLSPPAIDPVAVTLSVMEITPEAIEAAIDNPAPAAEIPLDQAPDVADPAPEPEPEPELEELAAVVPDAEQDLEPVLEDVPAAEAEPEILDPVQDPVPEAIAAVDASQLSPVKPEGDGGAGIAPVGALDAVAAAPVLTEAAPEQIGAVVPQAETVAAVSSLPQVVLPPEGGPDAPAPIPVAALQDPEVAQGAPGVVDAFILRIRGQLALPCIVATPRRDAAGDVELEFLAANESDVTAFAAELLAGLSDPPTQRNILVDPRQCPALNFIREGSRYPTFPLAIAVEAAVVESGGRLIGALQGAQGRFVTLIVVDDNGVVQDLAPFLSFSGDTVRFDVPMTRFGPARDTQALLMAVATAGRPTALDTHAGLLAEDFFVALRQTVDRNAPLAMIPFSLR